MHSTWAQSDRKIARPDNPVEAALKQSSHFLQLSSVLGISNKNSVSRNQVIYTTLSKCSPANEHKRFL